jgi:hypothetical protein
VNTPEQDRARVIELLRRVLDLLAGPQKHGENLAKVEEAHSFTASGIGCEAWDEVAARWSITGALAKFSMAPLAWTALPREHPLPGVSRSGTPVRSLRSEIYFDEAFRYLFGAAIMEAPQTVNGVNNRGWDAVKNLIELAIMLAEHDATIMAAMYLPNGRTMSPELRKRLEGILQARAASGKQVPS